MKPNRERDARSSAGGSGDDGGQVPPCFSALAPVGKELRGIVRCTSAHIIDGFLGDARVSKLQSNERGEIAMGFCGAALNDRPTACRFRHLGSDLFTDLEGLDANVRAERDYQLGGIVSE